jgi:hypothetical protein
LLVQYQVIFIKHESCLHVAAKMGYYQVISNSKYTEYNEFKPAIRPINTYHENMFILSPKRINQALSHKYNNNYCFYCVVVVVVVVAAVFVVIVVIVVV